MNAPAVRALSLGLMLAAATAWAQQGGAVKTDTAGKRNVAPVLAETPVPVTLWGFDLLLSNSGFGLGLSYRRQYTPDLAGQVMISVSESKEDREVEYYDPYTGNSFVPGKLNRFMVIPLTFGAQYRLFREDIVDTFRPYVNAGVGPTMIYEMPFVTLTPVPGGPPQVEQIEFFSAIGKGTPHFTAGGFFGVGAYFGSERSTVLGINIRYYLNYLFGDGLPSQYNPTTGEITGYKTSFGGFYITLNIGMG
jgi:outer membrane protein W